MLSPACAVTRNYTLQEWIKMPRNEPPDHEQEYEAPIAMPDDDAINENAQAFAQIRRVIVTRWSQRDLAWFRPQLKALIRRAKELRPAKGMS